MMDYITLEEFEKSNDYEEFIRSNPDTGTLKVQVFTPYQMMPIPNTKIYIVKRINDTAVLFFEGVTNASGIIDNIILPAPEGTYNPVTKEIPGYTTYDVYAVNDDYATTHTYDISMFGDVKAIQNIKMAAKSSDNNG